MLESSCILSFDLLRKRVINAPILPYDKGMKNKKGLVYGLRNGGSLLWVRDLEQISPKKRRKAPRFSHGDISRSLVPLYRNSETKLIGQLLLTQMHTNGILYM